MVVGVGQVITVELTVTGTLVNGHVVVTVHGHLVMVRVVGAVTV